ncbi:plasmid mobilization protein [Streptomyces sp. NPDC018029]|uniref:plasmid mobilization protein n=1 Tax=Streptomyces sp. NPDC018029 TaxID=3365032 RepID=UPI00378D8916
MDGAKPVQVLFTPDEYAAIARHADHLGMPVAEFVRRAVTVRTEERSGPCQTSDSRRGAAVPPVQRGLGRDGTPALKRFLDTLAASAEPKALGGDRDR